jgi:hypothetical protein
MGHFMGKLRFSTFMNVSSGLTVLAGALLYWRATDGRILAWVRTGPGLGFTLGSVVAIIVYLIGFFMIRPRADRMSALGKQIGMAGGPPNPEQAAELENLNRQLHAIGRVDFVLLSLSLILMATSRYWVW